MPKNLLVKNIPFDRVRAVITASQSSVPFTYYSEGEGNRFYVNAVSSTASPVMEAATFNSFLSFTMSGFATFSFDLIPMGTGNSAIIETKIYAQNTAGTKGFVQETFGAWRHSGSALQAVGGSMVNTSRTDFTTVAASWTASGTQSVRLTCVGQTSETLDWDVHISYRKGFHTILTGTSSIPPLRPIYPDR